jgi:hypothetical protein
MHQDHVDVLDELHVVNLDVEAVIDQRLQLAAAESNDADRGAADLFGIFSGAKDVR